jgi:hypothetical protein
MNWRRLGKTRPSYVPKRGRIVRPYSQKQPFERRDALIQGDSVRQVWGLDDPSPWAARMPVCRDYQPRNEAIEETADVLNRRLAEELEYARRMLDITGDELAGDPIAVARHGVVLQSLDIVGQMMTHIATVIRSSDPDAAVERIGMGDLKARLTRNRAL